MNNVLREVIRSLTINKKKPVIASRTRDTEGPVLIGLKGTNQYGNKFMIQTTIALLRSIFILVLLLYEESFVKIYKSFK